MAIDRVVIVTKRTPLENLILAHHTESAVRFLIERQGQSFETYKEEDSAYKAALALVRRQIPNDLPVTSVECANLPDTLFRDKDLIVVCGPDGLFVNLSQYVKDQVVLSVNPDPRNIAGKLMLFAPHEVGSQIALIQAGKHSIERLPFARALIDNEREVWGISDIFIGRKDQISARYEIEFATQKERQSSSGIIVSTGTGSTGWLRSIVAMVEGLIQQGTTHKLSWMPPAASTELVFIVQAPFPSPNTGVSIVTSRVTPRNPLTVVSQMPQGGFIFSDGMLDKAVEWKAGSKVVVSVGDRFIQRVIR